MKTVKKVLNHIFIDGLSGMAMGLFATLIVGTIIQQVGNLIGGQAGEMLFFLGKMAAAMTSAGIGVGVAHKFKEPPLVAVSAATAGMVGGFASKILAGTVLVDGASPSEVESPWASVNVSSTVPSRPAWALVGKGPLLTTLLRP